MLKTDYTKVYNWENAIRGLRHPLESYNISDSEFLSNGDISFLGENDKKLMKQLIKAGSDHRKFLRQILVSVDITAPLYWWKEASTYKVGTVANSTSTMHCIHKKPFTRDMFSFDGGLDIKEIDELIGLYEDLRVNYIETKDKKYWRTLIQLLVSSFNQTRMMTMNYEVLLNMYHSRKAHKLTEWHTFCDWCETLPYFKELCIENN